MTVEEWLGKDNILGIDIWKKKYQRNDETFDEWLDRVSGGDKKVRKLIEEKKFLFGGRILSNRGTDFSKEKASLSNCYVIDSPQDSIESIYDTCKKLARTYSYGGGCGINISKLAPEGARVRNQARSTSGAVSFMDTFSQVTEQIGQNNRRGALMISMDCKHPDIKKFITVKSDLNKVNYANISVMVSDEFMKAVKEDGEWVLTFTRPETKEVIEETVRAGEIFDLLCEQNWDFGEPGILFWDTVSNYNLLNNNPEFEYVSTNPCGEEPLPAFGSCNLGSLNLSAFVNEDSGEFNGDEFTEAVSIAVKALNDVLDEGMDKHPLKEQRQCARDWRQSGLGIFGLADCLIKMGLRYGSKESIDVCDRIGNLLAAEALATSAKLAKTSGAYPKYNDLVLDSSFYKAHENWLDPKERKLIKDNGLRNSQLLTIAPTGCQKGSTMICTDRGLERLDELVDSNGDKWQPIEGIDAIQHDGRNRLLKGFVNGYAPTKVIRLSNNTELECTHNHQYQVIRDNSVEWVRADQICVGDIVPRKINYYKKEEDDLFLAQIDQENYHNTGTIVELPERMTEDLAFILGAYYANGSNHYKGRAKKFHSIRLSMNHTKKEDMSLLCNKIFNTFKLMPTYSYSDNGACQEICLNSVNLCKWLEVNGLRKNKATNSDVPYAVRCSSRKCIKAFLDGYYMCDGSSNGSSTYIDTANYNIAQSIVAMYGAIGINAGIKIDTKRIGAKSKNPMYRIYFGGFMSSNYPAEKMRYVSKEKREVLYLVRQIMKDDDYAYDVVEEVCDDFCFTYDVEVENNHYYLANGYISHNTLSTMLGVSGGIEPIFANSYTRMTKSLHSEDHEYKVYTPIVAKYMEEHSIAEEKDLPEYFVTSTTIPVQNRINMQAVWQSHIDASISSTVNLPNEATVDDVKEIYISAWEKGLKGITVFRAGCARTSILTSTEEKEREKRTAKMSDTDGLDVIGLEHHLTTGCGSLHICAYFDRYGNLKNTYLSKGSSGGCNNFMISLSRMISLAARNGVPIEDIVDQLNSCGTCPSYAVRRATRKDVSPGSCCPVAIGNALMEMRHRFKNDVSIPKEEENVDICPECGGALKHEMGCVTCINCGYSKCN